MPYKRYKEKKINCQKRKNNQLSEEKKNVRKDVSFTWTNGVLVEKTKSE